MIPTDDIEELIQTLSDIHNNYSELFDDPVEVSTVFFAIAVMKLKNIMSDADFEEFVNDIKNLDFKDNKTYTTTIH